MKSARSLAIGVVALALLATGCTSSGDDEDTAAPGGTITVWTHTNKSFNKAYQELGDAYMAENPDATIEFETFEYDSYIQTLQTSLPAGNEADILQMFGSWTCSYADNLSTVPDDVSTLSEAEDAFFPGPLGGYQCDDQLYGMPQESNVEYGATLVNTAMAEDADVALDGWESFDEFKADAKKMTVVEDGSITRAGYHFTTNDGISYSLLSLILQNGGSYLAEDGTFTFQTPEATASMELMKSFVDEEIVDPTLFTDTANWVGDCYFTELCAMGLVGPWVVPEYATDFPEVAADHRVCAAARRSRTAASPPTPAGVLTVSSNSPEQELAWDFVSYVAQNDENALDWNLATGTLPALKANTQGDARDQLLADAAYLAPWLDILGDATVRREPARPRPAVLPDHRPQRPRLPQRADECRGRPRRHRAGGELPLAGVGT